MKYNPETHHRKSVRLKEYDYSHPGAYFITICTHNRESVFGHIENGELIFKRFGRLIFSQWNNIPEHFRNVRLDELIIMPNHIHGVLFITDVGAKHFRRKGDPNLRELSKNASPLRMAHGTKTGSLSAIIQNYKSVTTRKINKIRQKPGTKFWQRNYYEHIIRNEKELNQIRQYIIDNPLNWEADEENPKNWRCRGEAF